MYGLTLEQVREVRRVNACMICKSTESGFESGIFAVDHCHDSGIVRGALCQPCNLMLGNARDNIDVLLAAVKYLAKDHLAESWNQGPKRDQVLQERREASLTDRLERANMALSASQGRVRELEAILAAVDEEITTPARRRARDADAVGSFIASHISLATPDSLPVPASELRKVWSAWAGGAQCPVSSLADALYKLGGAQRKTSTGRYWVGIALRTSEAGAEAECTALEVRGRRAAGEVQATLTVAEQSEVHG
ncbi:endonuclease domain-containing protein [Streptomyces sp. NPDC056697]|uniref:endonuclease domain-containing protein n=1 Tax=Streptomyces sp. NPDC056697 TaxID=3345915 RepID=UPI0036859161